MLFADKVIIDKLFSLDRNLNYTWLGTSTCMCIEDCICLLAHLLLFGDALTKRLVYVCTKSSNSQNCAYNDNICNDSISFPLILFLYFYFFF